MKSFVWLCENFWIGFSVPCCNIFSVPVNFFETGERFLNQNSSSVVEVMGWHFRQVFNSIPSLQTITFYPHFFVCIASEKEEHCESKEESPFFHEIKITVVIHCMCWSCHGVVYFVRLHPALELNSVFRVYNLWISMVVVQIVMNGWRMEISWTTDCASSNGSATFDWQASLVISKVIHIVLGSLFF